jgi:hypothetical protein
MPKPQTLEAFVALVEAGRFVEAIERFHADDATMQENRRPPRRERSSTLRAVDPHHAWGTGWTVPTRSSLGAGPVIGSPEPSVDVLSVVLGVAGRRSSGEYSARGRASWP